MRDYCRCSSQRCIYLDVHAPLSLSLSLSLSEFVCSSLAPCLWCLCVWRRSGLVMFLYRPFFFTVMRRGMQTVLACPSGDLIASRWVWLLDYALRLLFFFITMIIFVVCLFVWGFFWALPFTGTAPPTSKPTHTHLLTTSPPSNIRWDPASYSPSPAPLPPPHRPPPSYPKNWGPIEAPATVDCICHITGFFCSFFSFS